MELISKIIILLNICISITYSYMGSYGDDIVTEFKATQNINGVILKSTGKQYKWIGMGVNTSIEEIESAPMLDPITLYLGKSYDAWSPIYGKGSWEQNNGGFLVLFESETFAFGRQELIIETDVKSSADVKQKSWIVVVHGSRDSVEAKTFFDDYKENESTRTIIDGTLAQKKLYPLFAKSDTIKGLNSGFWITIIAESIHKEVATTIASHFNKTGKGAYVREVQNHHPIDLRAININEILCFVPFKNENEAITDTMWGTPFTVIVDNELIWGNYHYDKNNGVLIPFIYQPSLKQIILTGSGVGENPMCSYRDSISIDNRIITYVKRMSIKAGCWQ